MKHKEFKKFKWRVFLKRPSVAYYYYRARWRNRT